MSILHIPFTMITFRYNRVGAKGLRTRTTHLLRLTFVLMRSNTVKLPTSKIVRMPEPLCPAAGLFPDSQTISRIELTKYLSRVSHISHGLHWLIAPSFCRVSSVNATHRSSSRPVLGENLFYFTALPRGFLSQANILLLVMVSALQTVLRARNAEPRFVTN